MTHDPQREILAYLIKGGRLTVQKASRIFETTELRRIVSRLRKKGHTICARKCSDVTRSGRTTQFNEYYMMSTSDSSK